MKIISYLHSEQLIGKENIIFGLISKKYLGYLKSAAWNVMEDWKNEFTGSWSANQAMKILGLSMDSGIDSINQFDGKMYMYEDIGNRVYIRFVITKNELANHLSDSRWVVYDFILFGKNCKFNYIKTSLENKDFEHAKEHSISKIINDKALVLKKLFDNDLPHLPDLSYELWLMIAEYDHEHVLEVSLLGQET